MTRAPGQPHPSPSSTPLPSYLWPTDGPDSSSLRRRVAASITCLFAAKCCNVIVPLSFKEVIDSFGGNPAAVAGVALPVALLAAYASSRLMAGLFSELRSALFARVSQNAVRSVSTRLFNHVQHLDLECVVCWPRCRAAAANLTQPEGITSAARPAPSLASLSAAPVASLFFSGDVSTSLSLFLARERVRPPLPISLPPFF
jgi:ABC-type multidrug transport system fused ATPase/permease subunit